MTSAKNLDELIVINTNDMLESFGLGDRRRGRRLLAAACYWPARRFAQTVLEFDRRVAEDGLHAAAAWGVRQFAAEVEAIGVEHLPPCGPVIVVANHPGITDTLAIFAALPRADLHTVAAVRPFLSALDNMTRRLIFVDEQAPAHLGVVRSVTRCLRGGGCVLTFPAGKIEPDPAVLPGASRSLEGWSDSIGLFARLSPAAQIVPLLVSGVFSPRSLRSPLARMRRNQKDRERFAAMLQVAAPRLYPVRVSVALGRPLPAGDLLTRTSSADVKAAVIAAMRDLLAASPRKLLT
jgi:1-acyl-sn-glycerol-3-phosphate acyltransferase